MYSIQGKEKTLAFRKLTLLQGLELEIKTGMKLSSKMPSAYSIIKKEYGYKGNKKAVYQRFFFQLVDEKILTIKN